MVELSIVRDLVAIFGVLAGFTYYVLTVKNTQKNQQLTLETRQAQLHLHIYDSMISSEFMEKWWRMVMWRWDTYEEFKEKHGPKSNLRDWSEFFAVGNYLENIGLLLKRGLLDKSYIDDLISGDIIGYWDRFEPIIKGIRTEYHWPQYNEWAEYLYNIVKPLAAEQHPEIDANRMMKP